MKVSAIAPLAFAACAFSGAFAQSYRSIVSDLDGIARAASRVQSTVSSMTSRNAATEAPQIATSIQDVIGNISYAIGAIETDKPFPDNEARRIVTAFISAASAETDLVQLIIEKKSVFQSANFNQHVSDAVLGLQGVNDAYLLDVINLVPTQNAEATRAKNTLDKTLEAAIMAYA